MEVVPVITLLRTGCTLGILKRGPERAKTLRLANKFGGVLTGGNLGS